MSTPAIARTSTSHQWDTLQEGKLLVDIYERPDALVVRALVAGVRPEHVQISLQGDMLTLRGHREETEVSIHHKVYQRECYWGSFSRTIILPCHVAASKIKAFFKRGILIVVLPKETPTKVKVHTEHNFL